MLRVCVVNDSQLRTHQILVQSYVVKLSELKLVGVFHGHLAIQPF